MANTINATALYNELSKLKDKGTNLDDVKIVIGDDEELNGVHSAFFINLYNMADRENDEVTEMFSLINECGNACAFDVQSKTDGYVLLIS